MNKPPFTLTITTNSGPDETREVVCRDVMRALGRTRTVYDATWQGRRIVVKVFARFGKARYHAMREWRGLKQLEARRVSAPSPLFFGHSPEGWAVATEWLDNAVTAQERWRAADTLDKKVQLLCLVVRQLARQHEKGVIQPDMHLGNFMVRGVEVFALDPAMMRFRRGPIGRGQSIRQVAQLAGMLPEDAGPAVESVFREYAEARSWTVRPQDLELLRTEHKRRRGKAIERGLRKFLRTNRRHQAIRQGSWQGLADRRLLDSASLHELTAGLDEAMSRGQILKDGRTSFVSRVKLGGIEVVVKRYNHKGLLHSLRHTLKGSRARKNWCNAHRLSLLGLATAKPLAYLDRHKGPLVWTSYFIARFVEGRQLHEVLHDPAVPENDKHAAVDQTMQLISGLAAHGITHGDLKHSNILCDGNRIVLIDLDGMRVRRLRWPHRLGPDRDLARFRRAVRADDHSAST